VISILLLSVSVSLRYQCAAVGQPACREQCLSPQQYLMVGDKRMRPAVIPPS